MYPKQMYFIALLLLVLTVITELEPPTCSKWSVEYTDRTPAHIVRMHEELTVIGNDLAPCSKYRRVQDDIRILPGSIKSFSSLLSLSVPALDADTLPQPEQSPPVLVETTEFFAIHPFGIFGASCLEQGCS
jgi:hypothetical protein